MRVKTQHRPLEKAQTYIGDIQPYKVRNRNNFEGKLVCVSFTHSGLAICTRPLMQNIQSILRGLTKEMFLLPRLLNERLHHKL